MAGSSQTRKLKKHTAIEFLLVCKKRERKKSSRINEINKMTDSGDDLFKVLKRNFSCGALFIVYCLSEREVKRTTFNFIFVM